MVDLLYHGTNKAYFDRVIRPSGYSLGISDIFLEDRLTKGLWYARRNAIGFNSSPVILCINRDLVSSRLSNGNKVHEYKIISLCTNEFVSYEFSGDFTNSNARALNFKILKAFGERDILLKLVSKEGTTLYF